MRRFTICALSSVLVLGISTTAFAQASATDRPLPDLIPAARQGLLLGAGAGLFRVNSYEAIKLLMEFAKGLGASTTHSPDIAFGAQTPSAGRTAMGAGADSTIGFAVVGEVGYERVTGVNELSLLGGGRVTSFSKPRLPIFGQALAGITRGYGESDLTIQPGAGVIMPLEGKRYGVTLHVDFPLTFYTGGHDTGFVLAAAISFPGR
jgi:hypothetical protein